MSDLFSIAGREIGPDRPTYLIAELSANHRQRIETAEELIRAAATAGADAIKLQTYTADTLTLASHRPEFRIGAGTLWSGRTLHDLYQEAFTPWEWTAPLKRLAESLGLALFSTPFDPSAVAYLSSLDVPAYKIASFEIVDLPLIECAARQGRPLILSTGMASLGEIEEAVGVVRRCGAPFALLHCVSAYPAPASEMNLRTIPHLAAAFACPTGLSDHTLGIA
ncbi:MAG TPA: N-acetylneuraminate synthase family protein, partial [Pirellulales bacterium]